MKIVFVTIIAFILITQGAMHSLAESATQNNEIIVELKDDTFNPDEITLQSDETTILVLQNKGVKDHTFTVRDLAIDVEVLPGQEERISVSPEQVGTYELICRYHMQEGMVGQVVVE
ncbi:cupredoxin domain-containing protein [Oceanobacillus luteolus]|uniref:Cupredoxin domain-containing protein n=1 Tax=Oceanobacillus luteolus TaxID=1274358 RepID=A0ABW4HN31_9BACI|nr:cupredoxin domain-containing protein [Oceanobacillus luteolus]MCM3742232.1 cupredoxin domain-containing protein [Oceanobacillus luteolus]